MTDSNRMLAACPYNISASHSMPLHTVSLNTVPLHTVPLHTLFHCNDTLNCTMSLFGKPHHTKLISKRMFRMPVNISISPSQYPQYPHLALAQLMSSICAPTEQSQCPPSIAPLIPAIRMQVPRRPWRSEWAGRWVGGWVGGCPCFSNCSIAIGQHQTAPVQTGLH